MIAREYMAGRNIVSHQSGAPLLAAGIMFDKVAKREKLFGVGTWLRVQVFVLQ